MMLIYYWVAQTTKIVTIIVTLIRATVKMMMTLSDEEGGSSVNAILGGATSAGAAADNDRWITQGQLRLRFPFSGNPGIKVNIADADDPLAYFELFFDDTLINMIVQQTISKRLINKIVQLSST